MKRNSHRVSLPFLILPVLIFGAVTTAHAQFRVSPVESVGDQITCHVGGEAYTLKTDRERIAPRKRFDATYPETQAIFEKVTPYTRLRGNIYTVPVTNAPNVEICPGEVNYIAYNADWLVSIYKETNSRWALYAVIAHEIGHYTLAHHLTAEKCDPEAERAADEYAGEVLARMGAPLPDAQAAFTSELMRKQSACYPPIAERRDAVEKGWESVRRAGPPAPPARARRSDVEQVEIGRTGHIKGLEGRLNPILDSENRTYLYADNIAIEGGRRQPVNFTPGEPFTVEDSLGNKFELNVVSIDADSSRIEYRRLGAARRGGDLHVRVVDENSRPVRGAEVVAIFHDGTYLKGSMTDSGGRARVAGLKEQTVTVYCAHPSYKAFYKESHDAGSELVAGMESGRGAGSVIIHNSGHVPGLDGALNPILDSINRTYLYASDIKINGGMRQPVNFRLDEPLELEDGGKRRFEVKIVGIIARTSLVEFRRLN